MTPLVLITGFLGSGKTSLLRAVLPGLRESGVRCHVILNDYANAAVDSATLRELVDDIVPLTGSCVCCDSLEALGGELEDMPLGERDVVLVETNGTTDPGPLVERLLAGALVRRFPVLFQVNLIDTKRWGRRIHHGLERLQVRTATHLIHGWLDQAGDAQQQKVREEVRLLNPGARVTDAAALCAELKALCALDAATVPAALAVGGALQSQAKEGRQRTSAIPAAPGAGREKSGGDGRIMLPAGMAGSREVLGHALSHRYAAVQFPLPRGIHPLQLVGWLASLPGEAIRAKGIVRFAGQEQAYHYFQWVDGALSFDELIWEPPQNLTLGLVIGVGLDEAALRAGAARWLNPPSP